MACHRLFAPRVGVSFEGFPSQTHQEFKHDSDINAIVQKFLRTGEIHMPNADRPLVDGFDLPGDFSEACSVAFDQMHQESFNQEKNSEEQQHGQQESSEDGSEEETDSSGSSER